MNAPICIQIQSYKKYSKKQICQHNMSTDVFLQGTMLYAIVLAIWSIGNVVIVTISCYKKSFNCCFCQPNSYLCGTNTELQWKQKQYLRKDLSQPVL